MNSNEAEGLVKFGKYIEENTKPEFKEEFGLTFCNKEFKPLTRPAVPTLKVYSLSSLVEYVNSGIDFITEAAVASRAAFIAKPISKLRSKKKNSDSGRSMNAEEDKFIHEVNIVDIEKQKCQAIAESILINIEAYNRVSVYKVLEKGFYRDCLLRAEIDLESIHANRYQLDAEGFIVYLQSGFVQDDNTKAIIELVSKAKSVANLEINDNGVAQKIATESGPALVGWEKIPNPVELQPFYNFPEIPHPKVHYVLRVKNEKGLQFTIERIIDSKWKLDTVVSIREYLKKNLSNNLKNLTVL